MNAVVETTWSGWDDAVFSITPPAPTFIEFARTVMNEREKNGVRGISQERSRFDVHIETASFAHMPIDAVEPKHVATWLREMQDKTAKDRRGARLISRHTIHRSLSLVSAVFAEAGVQGRGYIQTNPCTGLRVKARASEEGTKEKWTWLRMHEVELIEKCEAIDEADRLAILFAVATGLRQGEQMNLRIEDLVVDGSWPHVNVRFGSANRPPKNGKTREVPLLVPFGVRVAKRWLELLPAYAPDNPHGLVFPHANGRRRGVGKPLGSGWMADGKFVCPYKQALRAAGIERNVRWHDLRHTCASLLITGAFGEQWTKLPLVRDFLGHGSVNMTERYAHLGVDGLKAASLETAATAEAKTLNLTPANVPERVRTFLASLVERIERAAS